jgi:hypothetical protein
MGFMHNMLEINIENNMLAIDPRITQHNTFILQHHIPKLNIHLNVKARHKEHCVYVQCATTFFVTIMFTTCSCNSLHNVP